MDEEASANHDDILEPLSDSLQEIDLPPEKVEAVIAGNLFLDLMPGNISSSTPGFIPNRSDEAGRVVLSANGTVARIGLALHKLGMTTRLVGKIGDDLFGEAVYNAIESFGSGLAGDLVVAGGSASGYTVQLNHPKQQQTTAIFAGCNDTFGAGDIRFALLERAGLFHFGCPSQMARMYADEGMELVEILLRAKSYGVTTSLDFAVPDVHSPARQADWQAILTAVLPYVDVFVPTVEEMLFVWQRPLYDKLSSKANAQNSLINMVTPDLISEIGSKLLESGTKIVLLNAGHRGLYLRTTDGEALEQLGRALPPKVALWGNRELWAPCFATQVVKAVGAADATTAGFLLGLMRGMGPEAALSAACAVGASCVEASYALSGIKSWPALMERIANGWPRSKPKGKARSALDITSFGWHWHETHELWSGPCDAVHVPRSMMISASPRR